MKCHLPDCDSEAIMGLTFVSTGDTTWMCQAELYAYVLHAKVILEKLANAIALQEVFGHD